MIDSLLQTKLRIPPARPNLVSRPRLLKRLDAALSLPLTVVSAPPGFGKTTLLAEWIHHDAKLGERNSESARVPHSIAWLSLDESDDDPTRFWSYAASAFDAVCPGVIQSVAPMLGSPQPPIEATLTALLNALASVSDHLVLILDDYHLITAEAIHSGLAFLVDHLPPTLHLVIVSRADPPLPLPRLRARGQLLELRAADLRFTAEEAAGFLDQVMGLSLSAEQVSALEARTEGWIAGLQLAALSMQGREDVDGFIAAFTGSHHYIVDYLAAEILARQPSDVQTFLLCTSILDRLCAPLCAAILQSPISNFQSLLEHLDHSNLFLVPLDNDRQWYRYHRLFADFLRNRLFHIHHDQLPELHTRASEWLAQNGFTDEALRHAMSAQDWGRASRLVGEAAPQLMQRGEMNTMLNWLVSLPDPVVRSVASLCILHAWALFLTGHFDAAERRLQDAEAAPDLDSFRRGEIAAMRSTLASAHNDLPGTIQLAQDALANLAADNPMLRGVVTMNLGVAYLLTGRMDEARRALLDAIEVGRKANNDHAALTAARRLGQLEMMMGRLHEAAAIYRSNLPAPGRPRLPVDGYAHLGLGEVLYEWNQFNESLRNVQEGVALGQQGGHIDILANGYVILSRVKCALGDNEGALAAVQGAEAQRLQQAPGVVSLLAAQKARVWLSMGNVSAASDWAQSAQSELNFDNVLLDVFERLSLVHVWLAQNEADAALRLLDQLLPEVESRQWIAYAVEALALKAIALKIRRDADGAFSVMGRALALGEPGGFVRTFVDLGEPIRLLIADCRLLIAKEGQADLIPYAGKLLAAFGQQLPIGNQQSKTHNLIEPLSDRELEVIRLVADGLSNQEIADRLVVSLSTVKTHINNLYGKFGVKTRTQALARARELKLM